MALNRGYEYREIISAEAAGVPLLDHLARRYGHSSQEEWLHRIESGLILLDGERAHPGAVLRAGQALVWNRPPWEEPGAPLCFAVLHRDREILAVAKPAGLPTVPAGGFLEHTLLSLVRAHDPGAAPLHRLGRWTSGLVLFARTRQARSVLSGAWRSGSVLKVYRALGRGNPGMDNWSETRPIGPVPHAVLGTVHAASPRGKSSRTDIVVLERREGSFLAEATLLTGRPHQIRIHLAASGHPLLGDPLYVRGGTPADGCTVLPGDPGYHLHALRLRLDHPATGDVIDLRCAPPPVLRRISEVRPGTSPRCSR